MDSRRTRARRFGATGFTLIELMVVLAIIMLAAGLMTPTLTDFFSNRQLDALRGEFGSVFNRARLRAVTEGRKTSVVFFQEGARIFDEDSKIFVDERWNASSSAFAGSDGDVWYVLGCAEDKPSFDPNYYDDPSYKPPRLYVPPFHFWEDVQLRAAKAAASSGRSRGSAAADPDTVGIQKWDTSRLLKITFNRDGTLSFGPGASDVPTTTYNLAGTSDDLEHDTGRGDIMIFQKGNTSSCYMDVRSTGQLRSKVVVRAEPVVDLVPFLTETRK